MDVIVLGSGAAGLAGAAVTATAGASVLVLERAPLVGGTTAVSGGMVWVPCNPHMGDLGITDSRADALAYVRSCGAGQVPDAMCEAYVDGSAAMVEHLEATTPVRFRAIDRPDYRPEWPGGRAGGRTLETIEFDSNLVTEVPVRPRRSLLPLTHAELVASKYASATAELDLDAIEARRAAGVVTLGSALAHRLVRGCLDAGVRFRTETRARHLLVEGDRVVGVRLEDGEELRARRGVLVATGGFEWNEQLRQAFLGRPLDVPVSPPWNEGDGLMMGQRVGSALGNMTEAWWVPTYLVPGETYDGQVLGRHLGSDLSLPGSILVNRAGRRFVNESVNYNDLSAAFGVRDPSGGGLANVPCWMVFDRRCQERYQMAGCTPGGEPPAWWVTASSIGELADAVGIDRIGLETTVAGFAHGGVDPEHGRGESAHDRYYGDPAVTPNPCLAPLDTAPFYAVQVHPGAFGTKGGLATDERARVVDVDGTPIAGLYAAGNASAGATGPGYPGAGATLGCALTFGYLAGLDLVAS